LSARLILEVILCSRAPWKLKTRLRKPLRCGMRCLVSSLNTANGEGRASPSPPVCLRVNSTDPANGGRRPQRSLTGSARGNSRVGPPEHGGGGPRRNARVVRRRRRGPGKNTRSRWLAVLVFPRFPERTAPLRNLPGLRHLRPRGRRWPTQSKLACASSQRRFGRVDPRQTNSF